MTKQGEPSIADKEITCWKIVETLEDRNGDPVRVTPYMFRHIPDDVINGERPFWTGRPECTYELCEGMYNHILDGYIHTFATPRGESEVDMFCKEIAYAITPVGMVETFMTPSKAEGIPNCVDLPNVLSIALYRCAIPRGTEYLEGVYDGSDDIRCYASREIVFKEKVAEWDLKYCPEIKDKINSIIEDATKRGIPL